MDIKNDDNELLTKGFFRKEMKKEMDESFERFAVIVNGAFANQQRYIDKRFDEVDERFETLESKMNSGFEGVHRRIDDITVNYTRQDQHNKLEKRVKKLEAALSS